VNGWWVQDLGGGVRSEVPIIATGRVMCDPPMPQVRDFPHLVPRSPRQRGPQAHRVRDFPHFNPTGNPDSFPEPRKAP
jgi:hypothetical protein